MVSKATTGTGVYTACLHLCTVQNRRKESPALMEVRVIHLGVGQGGRAGMRQAHACFKSEWWFPRCVHFIQIIKLYPCDLFLFVCRYRTWVKRNWSCLRKDWGACILSLSKYRILFKIQKETSSSYQVRGRSNKYKLKQQRIWPGRKKHLVRIRTIQIQQRFVGWWPLS